jgi:hypothetical protein
MPQGYVMNKVDAKLELLRTIISYRIDRLEANSASTTNDIHLRNAKVDELRWVIGQLADIQERVR